MQDENEKSTSFEACSVWVGSISILLMAMALPPTDGPENCAGFCPQGLPKLLGFPRPPFSPLKTSWIFADQS
jgi:hypothetical protein